MTDAPGPSKQGGAAVPPAGASALPPQLQAANASKDDRTWGMIAHLSALAGFVVPFGSVIGPLVVFLIKKDQSPFVAFHAKQCLWLQIFAVIVAVVFIVLGLVICVTLPLGILVGLAAIVYAIYGAIQVSSGKDFQYYWVGEWVRKQG
jgi:hypothetical protein